MKTKSNERLGKRKLHVVSARISAETNDVVEAVAEAYEVSRSRAVEMMLMRHDSITIDEVEVAAHATETRKELNEVRDAFNDSFVELQRIGNNLNQAVKLAHKGDDSELRLWLGDVSSELAELRVDLNSLIQAVQARSEVV